MGQISKNKQIKAELIDLRDWQLPFYNEVSGVENLYGKFSIDLAKKWGQKIKGADGYIIVTPEYNHGYPAVLKNALDYAYYEWNKKPVAFVAYGGVVGGARSVEQLRLVVIELQMVPISNALYFPKIRESFDDSAPKDPLANDRLNSLLEELVWWAKALKDAREKS